MKKHISSVINIFANDKHLLAVTILFGICCLILFIFLITAIHPSERQVAVHYTSFGTTNFYRGKWYYLLSFGGLTAVMAIMHLLLTFRILQEKKRDLAIAFAWLGVVIAIISFTIFIQIFKIASII